MPLYRSQLTGTIITFDERAEEVPGIMTFRFRRQAGLHWIPGQYFVYVLPQAWRDRRGPWRPFSVAAAPAEGHLQITTRLPQQPSRFKQELMRLKTGDHLYAAGPFGTFVLTPDITDYVFVAGGIGVTPFRAMLAEAAAHGHLPNVTLLYAGRPQHLPFQAEFNAWSAAFPNFRWHLIADPERIDALAINKYVPDPHNATYLLSGPRGLVDGAGNMLQAAIGVPPSQVKHDVFKGYPWPLL